MENDLATAFIRNNETGEIVSYVDEHCIDANGAFDDFIWSEGNYACDCNRADFFYGAKGTDQSEHPECGDNKYSVKIIRKSTGEVLYDEFEE